MWERTLLLAVVVSGCGADKWTSQSLVTALPSRKSLAVAVPAAGTSAAVTAGSTAPTTQTAELYILTRDITTQANAQVGGVLDTLSSIAQGPPAATGAGTAAWGPFTDALSPVAWRLVIQQLGDSSFAFQLDVRPKAAADTEYQAFLQGASADAASEGPSQGTFSVNYDVAQKLDPVGNPLAGQLVAAWNVLADRREVHLQLANVHAPADPPTSADIGAVLFPDGSGAVSLDANANFLGTADQLEMGQVGTRWNSTGAGRGDARVHVPDGGAGVEVTECWDVSFNRVYFQGETADAGDTEGSPSACVF